MPSLQKRSSFVLNFNFILTLDFKLVHINARIIPVIKLENCFVYLVFKRDDPRLNDLQGVVRHGLGDGILLELGQVIADLREKLPGNDEAHVLIDDGLDKSLLEREMCCQMCVIQ